MPPGPPLSQTAYEGCEGLLAGLEPAERVLSGQCFVDAGCRLLGLYKRPVPAAQSFMNRGPSTVVIRDDDCRHACCALHGRFEQ